MKESSILNFVQNSSSLLSVEVTSLRIAFIAASARRYAFMRSLLTTLAFVNCPIETQSAPSTPEVIAIARISSINVNPRLCKVVLHDDFETDIILK